MKSCLFIVLCLGLGLINARNVVSIPFTKVSRSTHGYASKIKRSIAKGDETLSDAGVEYFAKVEVGTPPQILQLDIDTGSSDTWVFDAGSSTTGCGSSTKSCNSVFDAEKSKTFKKLEKNELFSTYYADNSSVQGVFFKDRFSIAGLNVTSMQMGLVTNSSSNNVGILGLSYPSLEAGATSDSEPTYPTLVEHMVSQKLINAPTYSLWLNGGTDDTGMLLFGGIDTSKFHGELRSTPVQPWPGQSSDTTIVPVPKSFFLSITSMSLNGAAPNPDTPSNLALLDSGTSLTYFPSDFIEPITSAYNATYRDGFYDVNCDFLTKNPNDYVEFQFAAMSTGMAPSIRVPISQLIIPRGSADSKNKQCILGFSTLPGPDLGFSILGDVFLRSAYAVFDMKNGIIGLAQAASGSSNASSIVEIEADSTTIPVLRGTGSGSNSSSDDGPVDDATAAGNGTKRGSTQKSNGFGRRVGRPSRMTSLLF